MVKVRKVILDAKGYAFGGDQSTDCFDGDACDAPFPILETHRTKKQSYISHVCKCDPHPNPLCWSSATIPINQAMNASYEKTRSEKHTNRSQEQYPEHVFYIGQRPWIAHNRDCDNTCEPERCQCYQKSSCHSVTLILSLFSSSCSCSISPLYLCRNHVRTFILKSCQTLPSQMYSRICPVLYRICAPSLPSSTSAMSCSS